MFQDKCKSSLKYVSTTTVYSRKATFEGCRSISTYSKTVSCNISDQKLLLWVNVILPREYDIIDWGAVTCLDPVIFFKSTVTE